MKILPRYFHCNCEIYNISAHINKIYPEIEELNLQVPVPRYYYYFFFLGYYGSYYLYCAFINFMYIILYTQVYTLIFRSCYAKCGKQFSRVIEVNKKYPTNGTYFLPDHMHFSVI